MSSLMHSCLFGNLYNSSEVHHPVGPDTCVVLRKRLAGTSYDNSKCKGCIPARGSPIWHLISSAEPVGVC